MSSAKEEIKKEVDIFRDTPVRLLGYSNEVRTTFPLPPPSPLYCM